jgi:hypothetical protein
LTIVQRSPCEACRCALQVEARERRAEELVIDAKKEKSNGTVVASEFVNAVLCRGGGELPTCL